MFKMTFSKIKKLCSVALIPRILRDEVTLSPRKLGKRPLDGFWKMSKSTDSKDREAECEKCKKIIEMVFGREKQDSLLKHVEANIEDIQIDKIQKAIAPNIILNEKSNEKSSLLPIENAKKGLEAVENASTADINETAENKPVEQSGLPLDNVLHATTAKLTEEQLAQKLETIEEPVLVEAATPKIDGFNTPPKVLGDQENILDGKNSLCTKIGPEEDAMDEIAKKCLGTPPDKIDERILEEMKSCGMLGRGRKKQTSRKSGYHAMKCNNKDALLETKSEQSTLYYKNQQSTGNPLNNYPLMRYHDMKFAHNPENVYPAYFKNVPVSLIGDGHSDRKTNLQHIKAIVPKEEAKTIEDVKTTLDEEKSLLVSSDHSRIDSDKKSSIMNDETCNKTEIPEELSAATNAILEEKPKVIIENAEAEVEEIRVTAAETSRLGIPGETEIDPDFDHKYIKPDVLPSNEFLQTAETPMEDLNEPTEYEHIVLSNAKHPTDWHFRPDLPDRPFNNPNTAISSTFPQPDQKQEPETSKYDTSISSKQNPEEYFDLSHCNVEKVQDDYVISLSEIRPLAAYHQYTIFTKTDEAQAEEQVLFSTKDTPEISVSHSAELKQDHQAEKQEVPKPINKDISATMGPLPQLKDLEEEVSLTELLRRVRERNRIQYCRECAFKALEPEPAEANKCPPPLDKGPAKTLGPGPCKPKPKPACPPPPPACPPPSPCKPKDPCAKFTKTSIIGDRIKEAFTLVLQVAFKPVFASSNICYKSKTNSVEPLRQVLDNEETNRIEKLGSFLLSSCPESKEKRFGNEDVILARDYEPWSPIPSWPIPKKEKKEPFVCPKEGCKIIPPPRLNAPFINPELLVFRSFFRTDWMKPKFDLRKPYTDIMEKSTKGKNIKIIVQNEMVVEPKIIKWDLDKCTNLHPKNKTGLLVLRNETTALSYSANKNDFLTPVLPYCARC